MTAARRSTLPRSTAGTTSPSASSPTAPTSTPRTAGRTRWVGGWEWGGPVSSDDPPLPLASAFDLHALSVLCLFRCRGLDLGRCCALGSLFSCWNDSEVSDPTLFCWDTIGLSNLTIWKGTRSATSTLCSFSSYYCVVLLSTLLHLRNLQIALRIHGVSRLLCWLVKCTGATMIGICILVMP